MEKPSYGGKGKWFQLIQLETLLFTFIKSLRDADFGLFLDCLKSVNKWMFSLGHPHYACWLTVFIKDLEQLNPEVLNAFNKGYFTVKPSKRIFSNIGIDQAHEQNNKLVKTHGSAIGILENSNELLRWALSGPVVAELCRDEKLSEMSSKNYHENTQAFESDFRKDFKSLYTSFHNLGNPFEEKEKNLVQIATKVVLDYEASTSIKNGRQQLGENQYNEFVRGRIYDNKESFYNILRKNKLRLFKQNSLVMSSKTKQKIVKLTSDCKLYYRLSSSRRKP